ncbi:hypothetical protein C4813_24130, partial [Salmonella enterica subsp. enterica serovar Rubislaw]
RVCVCVAFASGHCWIFVGFCFALYSIVFFSSAWGLGGGGGVLGVMRGARGLEDVYKSQEFSLLIVSHRLAS